MSQRRQGQVRLVACIVTLALVGCGSSDPPAATSGPSTEVEIVTSDTVAAATTTPAAPDSTVPDGVDLDARGTLTFTVTLDQPEVTKDDLDRVVVAVRAWVDSIGVQDASITNRGGQLAVVLEDTADVTDEVSAFAATFSSHRVDLRPVLQCFASPDTTVADTPVGSDPDDVATAGASDPTETEILPMLEGGSCDVGPAAGTGDVFEADPTVELRSYGWVVTASLRPGAEGEDVWNALAARCYAGDDTCPTKQLAIVLDGQVVSAPTLNAPSFSGSVEVSGAFAEESAHQLADALGTGTSSAGLIVEDVTFVAD